MNFRVFYFFIIAAVVSIGCKSNSNSCSNEEDRYESELWSVALSNGLVQSEYTGWKDSDISLNYLLFGLTPDNPDLYYVDDLTFSAVKKINLTTKTDSSIGITSRDWRVALSPDGQTLVYQDSDKEGKIGYSTSLGENKSTFPFNPSFQSTWSPVWLGDSQRVLFTAYGDINSGSGLFIYDFGDQSLSHQTGYTPRWRGSDISPDGTHLVFIKDSTDFNGDRFTSLYLKDTTTSDSTWIGLADRPVKVSSNGKFVSYMSGSQLIIFDVEEHKKTILTNNLNNDTSIHFSNAGDLFIFENEEGLILVELENMDQTVLVPSGSVSGDARANDTIVLNTPVFSTDDSTVYFLVSRHILASNCN